MISGMRLNRISSAKGAAAATGGWDIANASFADSHSVQAQESLTSDMWIKPDGTRLYVVGQSSNEEIEVYSLSTPFSLASGVTHLAGYSHSQVPDATGIWISDDGTKLFVQSPFGSDLLGKYTMSPGWDFSTISFAQSTSTSGYDSNVNDIAFKPDGTVVYLLHRGNSGDGIQQVPLSTAWDLSTLGTTTYSLDFSVTLSTTETSPQGIYIKPDGSKIYFSGNSRDLVMALDLSTAWDLSTASEGATYNPSIPSGVTYGMCLDPNGEHMYVMDRTNDTVRHYTVPSF